MPRGASPTTKAEDFASAGIHLRLASLIVPSPWFNFAVALAIGLLIGLERERTKGEGPARRPAGIRTFALATLLGAIAIHVGGALLLTVSVGSVAALTALSFVYSQDPDRGLTTEMGLVAAPLLGIVQSRRADGWTLPADTRIVASSTQPTRPAARCKKHW